MRYQKSDLDGSLNEHGMIPIAGSERGLFYGSFLKTTFTNLDDFARFTQDISSLAQAWYTSGDIDEAFEWYSPQDSDSVWIETARKQTAGLRDWITDLGTSGLDPRRVPDWHGEFYWAGDAEEFGLVGVSEDRFFEVFIADTL